MDISTAPIIVFGESSASVFLIQELIKQNESIFWVNGSGVRLIPVMPYVKSEKALGILLNAKRSLDPTPKTHELERGVFHRVFRNKAFKLPTWVRAANKDAQEEAFRELVWKPEQTFLGTQEFRLQGITPVQIETELRKSFETHPSIRKIQNTPIVEFEVYEQGGKVQFADGAMTEFKQFYFCDSLSELKALPKLAPVFQYPLSGMKSNQMMNAIQVVFHHSGTLNQPTDIGFVIPLNRDAGEDFDRDVLGYFLDDRTSVWTVFLKPSECEENHEIMKKLRKLKQALNRAFEGADFLSSITEEQFRFEENCLMVEGHLKVSHSNMDFVLLPDSFGFTHALDALAERFKIEATEFDLVHEVQVHQALDTPRPETDTTAPDL